MKFALVLELDKIHYELFAVIYAKSKKDAIAKIKKHYTKQFEDGEKQYIRCKGGRIELCNEFEDGNILYDVLHLYKKWNSEFEDTKRTCYL